MAQTELDLDGLKAHIGRRQESTDVVLAAPANLLRLTLGRDDREFATGDPLPPGSHPLFPSALRPDELRDPTGPRDAGVMPPMPSRAACSLASASASTGRSASARLCAARPSWPTSR